MQPSSIFAPANRTLDRRIAVEFMGWVRKTWHDPYDDTTYEYLLSSLEQSPREALALTLPYFSTNQQDADAVVERLYAIGWAVDIQLVSKGQRSWQVALSHNSQPKRIVTQSTTLPHAICLAALQIKG